MIEDLLGGRGHLTNSFPVVGMSKSITPAKALELQYLEIASQNGEEAGKGIKEALGTILGAFEEPLLKRVCILRGCSRTWRGSALEPSFTHLDF